jgi:hypothetical protein
LGTYTARSCSIRRRTRQVLAERFEPESEHVVQQSQIQIAQRTLVEHDVLVVLQPEVATADEGERQLVCQVVAAVHASTEQHDRIVEHADARCLFDGVQPAAKFRNLADVPPGDGVEVVARVMLGRVVFGTEAACARRTLLRERAHLHMVVCELGALVFQHVRDDPRDVALERHGYQVVHRGCRAAWASRTAVIASRR